MPSFKEIVAELRRADCQYAQLKGADLYYVNLNLPPDTKLVPFWVKLNNKKLRAEKETD